MNNAITTHGLFLGMTWADYVILAVILFSVILSFIRGFMREALSLTSWIIAFWIAFAFHAKLALVLAPYLTTPSARTIVSFGILFIVTLLLGSLLGFLLSRVITSTGLSGTNRCMGLIFGLARGILLIGVMLLLLSITEFTQDAWWQHSLLIPYFHPLIIWLKGFVPGKIGQLSHMITSHRFTT